MVHLHHHRDLEEFNMRDVSRVGLMFPKVRLKHRASWRDNTKSEISRLRASSQTEHDRVPAVHESGKALGFVSPPNNTAAFCGGGRVTNNGKKSAQAVNYVEHAVLTCVNQKGSCQNLTREYQHTRAGRWLA